MTFGIGAAASYGFDQHGERFFMREYRVGDRLQWVEPDSPQHDQCFADRWDIQRLEDGSYLETDAAGKCPACHADIIADVRYRDMMIESFDNVRIRSPIRPKPTNDSGT